MSKRACWTIFSHATEHYYSKCGPQTNSISILWKLVSNANPVSIPDLLNENFGGWDLV